MRNDDMDNVVTYQLAYLTHVHVDLCDECVGRDDHERGTLGPVSHGLHEGLCEGKNHRRNAEIAEGTTNDSQTAS